MEKREGTIVGVYALALAVFAAVGIFLYVHFERYGDRAHWVTHTLEVITSLKEILGDMKDIETGQRGYLLAGEPDFLEPFEGAVGVVRGRLDSVETLTSDNPVQRARVRALRPVVEKKIAFSNETITMFGRGERARARERVASREGKLLMDDIRRRIAALEAEERHLLAVRSSDANAVAWRTTTLLVTGNGVAFALLAIGTLLLGRELNRRKRVDQETVLRTERVDMETTTQEAERRLEAVIEELPVAVVIADRKTGLVALQNARMRTLTGNAPLAARRADGSPYPPDQDPLGRALREGTIVHGEELQLGRSEQPAVTVIADTAPVRDRDGRVLGAVGVFQDIAELRKTEAERREGARFRELFVGALGHDLRNPLSVITAGSASLARRLTSAPDLKLVQRMTSSANRMTRMIAQLLELVQIRLGGGLALDPQRMDLGELTRNVLDQVDVMHPDRTLELTTEGEVAGDWDRERLAEVVRNVVENALEHGRADAPVTVTVRGDADLVVLVVRNQGNPIPQELIPLIFDPFRRAEERKRMKSAGLGIGLYLAQQTVLAHGGTINVSSAAGAETVFSVMLPRRS